MQILARTLLGRLVALIFVFALSSTVYLPLATSVTFTSNVKVNTNPDLNRPVIAVGADYSYVVWTDTLTIQCVRKLHSQTTYGYPFSVESRSGSTAIRPDADVDSSQKIYVVWQDDYSGTYDIWFAKSTVGDSWSSPVRVNSGTVGSQFGPQIKVTPDGTTVYVVWTSTTASSFPYDYDIYFSYSTNGGASFSTNVKVNDDSTTEDQTDPDICAYDTNVYLSWIDKRDSEYAIYFSKSTNSGQSFGTNMRIDGNLDSATLPSIAVDDVGVIYCAYYNWRSSVYDIYITRSTNGGTSFTTPTKLNDVPGIGSYGFSRDKVDVKATSNIISVVWTSYDGGSTQEYMNIRYRYSYDYSNWGASVIVNDDVGTYEQSWPSMAVYGANVYIVWQDNRNAGDYNIYYSDFMFDNTAPSAPLSPSITPSGWSNVNSFSVDWTNPADPSGIKTGAWYKIGSSPTSNTDGIWNGAKPMVITSIEGEQTIYFWLEDTAGNRDYTQYATVIAKLNTTPPATVPTAPLNLQTSAGDGYVLLEWSAPDSDGGATITGYNVYRGESSGSATLLTALGNLLTYLDEYVTNGQDYYYQVSAENSVGEGAISNEAIATPIAGPTAPSAPQSLEATSGNGEISLTWLSPSSDGGSSIMGYTIYRGTTSGSESLLTSIGNVLSYANSGLSAGQIYYYRVSAVNSEGEGAKSNEANAMTFAPPSAPQSFIATPGNGEIFLSWVAPVNDGGTPITGYKVYRGTAPSQESLLTSLGVQLTWTDDDVLNGEMYYYKIKATNAVDDSVFSDEDDATPEDDIVSDTDSDGLPDAWENSQLGSLTYDAGDDPDGDGYTNIEEYEEHTDPDDVSSNPEMLAGTTDNNASDLELWIGIVSLALAIILPIAGVVYNRRKKREGQASFQNHILRIDNTFSIYCGSPEECARKLVEYVAEIDLLLKQGKLPESQYNVLRGRVDEYLMKLRGQI